jgi:glycosyltransferase involved in cell wall biosynthesis
VAEFGRREGVAVLGPKPYEDVPAYMQGLDVGLIPFRASDPYVQGINPNKVYQYLAAGRPVLTTPLLDLEPSPPDLLFASSHDDWQRALDQVLDAAPDPERRRALARPHDWDALSARMVAEIERRLAAA